MVRVTRRQDIGEDASLRRRTLDRQINDLTETICEVGRSDILTAKLKELETERQHLPVRQDRSRPAVLITDAADKWRDIVVDLESLNQVAQPDEMETARRLLREIIGEITVVEDDTGVIAYPKISSDAVYKSGAEKRT